MTEKPSLYNLKATFTQDADCMEGGDCQIIHVTATDGGGGFFYRLKTDGWAIDDPKGIAKLVHAFLHDRTLHFIYRIGAAPSCSAHAGGVCAAGIATITSKG